MVPGMKLFYFCVLKYSHQKSYIEKVADKVGNGFKLFLCSCMVAINLKLSNRISKTLNQAFNFLL